MTREEIEARRRIAVPIGALKITAKDAEATAYVYADSQGRPCAKLFLGRAWRPTWCYRFGSVAAREKRIRSAFASAAAAAEYRAQRKANGRGLEVGDILSACWGYDQTNYNYYQVTALIGATMVELREVEQEREETDWMQGKCVPAIDRFKGEPLRRRANNGYVRIDDVRGASKMKPVARIGNRAVYPAGHYTAYA